MIDGEVALFSHTTE